MTGVLLRREETQGELCDDGRDRVVLGWPKSSFRFFCNISQKNPNELFGQPNTSTSQKTPRIAGNYQKLGERLVKDSLLELTEKAWLCQHLDFRLAVSKTVRE